MRRYRIGGQTVAADAPGLQAVLHDAHADKLRPLCLCREPGVPMYIACIDGQYFVKRMPLSGDRHDPACEAHRSYSQAGLAPLIGGAIRIDAATGNAIVNLGFSLSRATRRGPATQTGADEPAGPVRNASQQLSLRGLLHYLWATADLTEWRASWQGRRRWRTVHSRLLDAATLMIRKRGGPIRDSLFVPEPFYHDDKPAIAARRAKAMAGLHVPKGKSARRMLLVGEMKKPEQARRGHRIVIRHMPDFPFMIDEASWQRLRARYQAEFEMWEADETVRLIAIATFGLSVSGLAVIDEIAVMSTTENWIPFETRDERRLLDRLAHLHETSVRELCFDLQAGRPAPCATLPRNGPDGLALYIVPAHADAGYEQRLGETIAEHPETTPWIWRLAEGDMPSLPPFRTQAAILD